ncbi:c-type cytochrome [Novosphingobium sp.]|uniref:c-type cytochrome n=1 Tax=Novosphingobium sp. TaxID=1874826 RepID=UPI003BAA8CA5
MRQMWRPLLLGAGLLLPVTGFASVADRALEWAFPPPGEQPVRGTEVHSLPGSALQLTWAQVHTRSHVPDWYPAGHPAAPEAVLVNRDAKEYACGYCHLATGQGRPENAGIAGLPRAYILEQVAAFRDGTRGGADPDFYPVEAMRGVAHAVREDDLAAAADYFSALPRTPAAKVIEASTIRRVIGTGFSYAPAPGGGTEPLGQRIIEMPEDVERFELRDPTVRYTAWVPKGSIARGQRLAARWGPSGAYACAGCHGTGYRGAGAVPPLAGKSPTGIVRQLAAFRIGARHGGQADLMRPVAAEMTAGDMIALAAFLAAQPVSAAP